MTNLFKNNNNLFLGGVILLAIIISGVIFFNKIFSPKNNMTKKSRAGNTNAQVILTSSKPTPQVNDEFTVSIKTKSNSARVIRLFKIMINFNKSDLQATKIEYRKGSPAPLGGADNQSTIERVNTNGKINILGQITSPAEGYTLVSNQETELALITFKKLSSGTTTISLDQNESYLKQVKSNESITNVNFDPATLNINSPTLTSPPLPTNTPTPTEILNNNPTNTPTPTQAFNNNPTNTPTPTETFTHKINWKTEFASLKADDFYILANGEKFFGDNKTLYLHSDPPKPGGNYTTLEAAWKERGKEMRLYIYFYKNKEKWWSKEMRTYNNETPPDWTFFKGKYFESPIGQMWQGKAVIFGSENGKGQIYFLNPRIEAFLKEDYSTVNLNLALRFQGILKKPPSKYNSMKVKVSIGGKRLTKPIEKIVTFTANDKAVWQGEWQDAFHGKIFQPGKGYYIYVKGPKHVQTKICDNHPNDNRVGGSYHCQIGHTLTLSKGKNDLDFSKIYMMAGDLPPQNGIINSYDISYIRNLLDKDMTERKKPVILANADLNLDGVVDTQDYALLIASLSIKYDQE